MIIEGQHCGELRKLVDHLPDHMLDVAIAISSVMVETAGEVYKQTYEPKVDMDASHYIEEHRALRSIDNDPRPIDDYDDDDEHLESCKWCRDKFAYLAYGDTCNSCLKLGRD